jgi:hypothetical protein
LRFSCGSRPINRADPSSSKRINQI